jgi:septum site-determining protein MinC
MSLKGAAEGIIIEINDIDKDIEELKEKLSNKKFFSGKVDFFLRKKDKEYYLQIRDVISEHGHELYLIKSEEEVNKEVVKAENIDIEDKTMLVKKTLRSGQKVEFDGTIVIVGDVNSGAEVFASGDVYIFGKARRMA